MPRNDEITVYVHMMTSSDGNIFRVTGPLCTPVTGEFPSQRPVTRSFDVFFDLRLNKLLSKQLWGWWFETPSRPLWRHCNELCLYRQYYRFMLGILKTSNPALLFLCDEKPRVTGGFPSQMASNVENVSFFDGIVGTQSLKARKVVMTCC